MNKKYQNVNKETIINRHLINGESVSSIVADTKIPRSTIYTWIKEQKEHKNSEPKVSLKRILDLERKIVRLEGIIEILKKAECYVSDPLEIKLPILEKLYGEYSVHMLCEALDVPRGTFYNHILRNKRDNTWYSKRKEEMRVKIQQIYDNNNQIFGAAKIHAVMKKEGYRTSVAMVRELMRDMGLISIRDDAKDFYDKEKQRYKNRLKQKFTTTAPNQVWVGDVTYYRFKDNNYYICVIIDLYARSVVGYKISRRNSTQLTKGTFMSAYEKRGNPQNLMFHSDRGGNYVSYAYREYLQKLNVTQSFSKSGVPFDNAVIESFFSNMKREELYRTKYRSEKEFKAAVDTYIKFYNENRPHKQNGYKTPAEKELEFFNNQEI